MEEIQRRAAEMQHRNIAADVSETDAVAITSLDLCSVEVDRATSRIPGRRLRYDITIDSGAGRSAMDPADIPEYELQSSEGQRRGQVFVGAGGERIPNLGQKTVPLFMADGKAATATFQAAAVRKPLMAVSASCDQGQLVLFDSDLSCMLNRDSPEGREIRRLAKQCIDKTCFERRNGVYTMPAWVVPPNRLSAKDKARTRPVDIHGDAVMSTDFHRQGR